MTGIAAASFFSNTCRFGGCGLHFPTLADLIEHIEDNHIGEARVGGRGSGGRASLGMARAGRPKRCGAWRAAGRGAVTGRRARARAGVGRGGAGAARRFRPARAVRLAGAGEAPPRQPFRFLPRLRPVSAGC